MINFYLLCPNLDTTIILLDTYISTLEPCRVEQAVARLTQEPEVPGSIPGPATHFRFFFR